jgi:glycerol-3-phosphate dehydrogenase
MKSAVVIGGGIHGFTCADELSKNGFSVVIVEKFDNIFKGASGATHNRAHSGFHYPRSIETAKECIAGLKYFEKHFPQFLSYPEEFYYFIEKSNTKTTTQQYIDFCDTLDLDYQMVWPKDNLLNRTNIDSSFLVREPCFNLKKIKDYYSSLVSQEKIKLITSFEIVKGEFLNNNKISLTNRNKENLVLNADIIINATYAYTNNVQKAFSVNEDLEEYHLQTTEVAVVESKEYIPPLTVMDGPFMTILPNVGTKDEYLVYDVVNSVVSKKKGYLYSRPKKIVSKWPEMLESGKKYFPFMESLSYKRSNVASRPILVRTNHNNDRQTKIKNHDCREGFYSILEGKFISAASIAESLIDKINKDGIL